MSEPEVTYMTCAVDEGRRIGVSAPRGELIQILQALAGRSDSES